MKKTLITIAFAVASMPMFAANQAPSQANPPAAGSTATTESKPAVKTKHHTKKASKKTSVKKDATTAPVAK
jgi:hypothetical protein